MDLARLSRKKTRKEGNVKVRRILYKIPLNPPLIKGDLRFPPFEKRGDFEIKDISYMQWFPASRLCQGRIFSELFNSFNIFYTIVLIAL